MEKEKFLTKAETVCKESFGNLMLEHQDFIFNVVKRYVVLEQQALDITQEVFVKAYENLDKFRGDSKFSSWLYRIAYNMSLNFIQREKDKEVQFEENFDAPSQEDLYDKIYEKEEMLGNALKRFEEMPEKYKIPLKLYYFEDKSYQEISEILKQPMNTVKVHILRGRKMLAEESKKV